MTRDERESGATTGAGPHRETPVVGDRAQGIRRFLNALPTGSNIQVFNHERSFGVLVQFRETGFGFGEITLAVDKATSEARCDLEAMSPEKCGNLLMRAVGTVVEDANAEYEAELLRGAERSDESAPESSEPANG